MLQDKLGLTYKEREKIVSLVNSLIHGIVITIRDSFCKSHFHRKFMVERLILVTFSTFLV